MSFWDLFTRRHEIELLERMLEQAYKSNEERAERADREATDRELLFRGQIADLKKAHAEELNRVIEDANRLRAENERFRLVYSPVDRKTPPEGAEESSTQPSGTTTFGEMVHAGTPWQRILAREIAAQYAVPIAKAVPATPSNEVTTNADGQSG